MEVKSGRYNSPLRREQAAATRDRIAASARRCFAQNGYAATTIETVATEAQVAVPTVYRVFGSKRALLLELLDAMGRQAAAAAEGSRADAADSVRQLRAEVEFVVGLFSDWADFLRVVRDAAGGDEGVAQVWREGEQRRRVRQRPLLRRWSRAGLLKDGLTRRDAADVLWAMTSPDVYTLFAGDLGWPPERLATWLTRMLAEQLLARRP